MKLKLFLGFSVEEAISKNAGEVTYGFLAESVVNAESSFSPKRAYYIAEMQKKDVASIKKTLSSNKSIEIEIIYKSPESFFASQAIIGVSFQESKEIWLSSMRNLIDIFTNARDQVNLTRSEITDIHGQEMVLSTSSFISAQYCLSDAEVITVDQRVTACSKAVEKSNQKPLSEVALLKSLANEIVEKNEIFNEMLKLQEKLNEELSEKDLQKKEIEEIKKIFNEENEVHDNQKKELQDELFKLQELLEVEISKNSLLQNEVSSIKNSFEKNIDNHKKEKSSLENKLAKEIQSKFILNNEYCNQQEALMLIQETLERKLLKLDNSIDVNYYRQLQLQNQWISARNYQTVKDLRKKDKLFSKRVLRQAEKINGSNLFDGEWYLSSYPDVESGSIEPAQHYILFGALEGRNPSASFDTLYYISENPDVAESGINPLIHYIDHGRAEGRSPMSNRRRGA